MISSMTITLSCVSAKSPMPLLVVVVMNSMIISYLVCKISLDLWTGTLLLMVYVSGVMVLFMYVVSLSPMKAEKKSSKKAIMACLSLAATSQIWSNDLLLLKEMNKFFFGFDKQLTTLTVVALLIIMMGSIIPSLSMSKHKGLKSSN